MKDERAAVPVIEQPQRSDEQVLTKTLEQEYDWLEEVRSSIASDAYQGEVPITWGGYHSKPHNVHSATPATVSKRSKVSSHDTARHECN